jgi:hypothetical protein
LLSLKYVLVCAHFDKLFDMLLDKEEDKEEDKEVVVEGDRLFVLRGFLRVMTHLLNMSSELR